MVKVILMMMTEKYTKEKAINIIQQQTSEIKK